jgi:hypothetical protein
VFLVRASIFRDRNRVGTLIARMNGLRRLIHRITQDRSFRLDFPKFSATIIAMEVPITALPSRIVCAAMLMDDGLIITGVRHYSPDMRAVLDRIYGEGYHKRVVEQGFINARGEFKSRPEARKVAEANGQIWKECSWNKDDLFSENLY